MNQWPVARPMEPYPSGLVCPSCRYDLGGARCVVCSECGRELSEQDVQDFRCRADAHAWARRAVRRQSVRFGGTAVVLGLGTGALSGAILTGFWASLLTGFVPAMSITGGWVLARFSGWKRRDLLFAAWLEAHQWLHGPWLCTPLFGLAVWTSLVVGPDATEVVIGVGFGLWLIACTLCLATWAVRYGRACRRLIRQDPHEFLPLLLALAVIACACVVGFAGGSTVVLSLAPGLAP